MGAAMSALDTSIVLIALPTIGKELQSTSPFDLIWVVVGYQLIISAVLVNFGRLSDMFGRVRLYTLGFALFTASSALCSLSQSGLQLVTFRMVQGLAAALLFSNSAAIVTDAFPLEERGRALGTNAVAISVGSVLGFVLGGLLTSAAGWRSIFWVNIPIGIVATSWSYLRLKELSVRRANQKLDIPGNIAFAVGVVLFLSGMSLYALAGLSEVVTVGLMLSGLAAVGAFLFIETRVEDPMLKLPLFRIRLFAAGTLAIFLNSLARGCVLLVLTFYLQGPNMNLDPFQAGLYLLPNTGTIAFFGPLSGYISDKRGPRVVATVGLAATAAGLLILTQLPTTATFWQLALPMALVGAGIGIFAPPNRSSVMSSVPPEDRGLASGISTTLINLGNSVSRSLAFVIMAAVVPVATLDSMFAGQYVGGGAAFAANFVAGIHLVFLISAAFVIVSIVPSALRGKGRVPPEGAEIPLAP
ncbi:MAG TPA: MFS transporter [Nitrososphaerales archaeon]|nr:MFS transporter [Nitrososphaerales archaeon]